MSPETPKLDLRNLFDIPKEPIAQEITDEQFYQNLYFELRDAIQYASTPLWGGMDPLYRTISKWRKNLSTFPEDQKEQFLARLGKALGVDSHLPK